MIRLFGLTCVLLLGACTVKEGKRLLGTVLDDQIIEKQLSNDLRDLDPAFNQAHINIISYNRIVLIVGQVPSNTLKALATKTARNIPPVRRVINELVIAGNPSLLTRTSDSLITARVRSAIDSQSVQGVKVTTELGTVYLMGLITREDGRKAVDATRSARGVRHIVKVFEYLRPKHTQ